MIWKYMEHPSQNIKNALRFADKLLLDDDVRDSADVHCEALFRIACHSTGNIEEFRIPLNTQNTTLLEAHVKSKNAGGITAFFAA